MRSRKKKWTWITWIKTENPDCWIWPPVTTCILHILHLTIHLSRRREDTLTHHLSSITQRTSSPEERELIFKFYSKMALNAKLPTYQKPQVLSLFVQPLPPTSSSEEYIFHNLCKSFSMHVEVWRCLTENLTSAEW